MTAANTTPKGAATRTRIVAVAADLFHERGVEATGLQDVLAASGTGKSQLYHYFDGKADLVDTVIDTQVSRIVGWHADLLAGVTDVDGLRVWADTVVAAVAARHGAHGCPLGSLATELSDRSEIHREHAAEGFARWQEVLGAAIDRAVPGRRRDVTADDAAVLLTALQGGLLLANTTHDVRHLRLALAAALDRLDGARPVTRSRARSSR